jgi:hypothetical protein
VTTIVAIFSKRQNVYMSLLSIKRVKAHPAREKETAPAGQVAIPEMCRRVSGNV